MQSSNLVHFLFSPNPMVFPILPKELKRQKALRMYGK
jgi:hypothetical protein